MKKAVILFSAFAASFEKEYAGIPKAYEEDRRIPVDVKFAFK